jgi:hypothetical protein
MVDDLSPARCVGSLVVSTPGAAIVDSVERRRDGLLLLA